MHTLEGKVALVTGASAPHGIGRAIALRLAQDGAAVVVTDIDGIMEVGGKPMQRYDLLKSVVAEIVNAGGEAFVQVMDVTNTDDIQSTVGKTISKFGRLDIVVNNAGSLIGSDSFLSTTPEQWKSSFEVNLLGPMMVSQAVIPQMREIGGGPHHQHRIDW